MGRPPGEGRDNVGVVAKNVEGGALVAAGKVRLQNARGVVGGAFASKDSASGLEELRSISDKISGWWKGDVHIAQPAE